MPKTNSPQKRLGIYGWVLFFLLVLCSFFYFYSPSPSTEKKEKEKEKEKVKEEYQTPCYGSNIGSPEEQQILASRVEPLTQRYVDVNTNDSSEIQNVYNQASNYLPYDKVGVYNGSFEQQQFINPPTSPKVYDKITDFPSLQNCNEEYWYTLGYLAPSSGDPFIETIQNNPQYYWYGAHLGESPILKFPSPFRGGCRPGNTAFYA